MRKKLRESYLDGEKLFKHYCVMGGAKSVSVLTRYAIAQKMISPNGKEPTRMGVWKAMWRWASLNRNSAYELFLQASQNGFDVADDTWWKEFFPDGEVTVERWNKMMLQKIRSAWQYPTESMYNRFLRKNGWV